MKIAITGASGLIGRKLLKTLTQLGHALHVLSRHAGTNLPPGVRLSVWDPLKGEPPAEALRGADAVINLAGEPVAQRWTAQARHLISETRQLGTRNLVRALAKAEPRPAVLVSASAVGYYGHRGDEILTESSPAGAGFLSEVCLAWEKEAQEAEALGIRVVRPRIGVVLDARGGALQRMLPAFRAGLGGSIAGGRQWMSWIHIDDLAEMFSFAIESGLSGPVNAVSPNPVTNGDFTRALAAALRRPAIFPVPAIALKAMFGRMSEVLLSSQRALPRAAESAGFQFRYADAAQALANLLTS